MKIELFLRLHGETILYAVFFGAIVCFGLLETVAAMRHDGAARQRRWPTNWGLTILNIAILGALPITSLLVSDFARDAGLGVLNLFDVPLWIGVLIGVALFSLQSWAVHFAMHHVPVLWRLHRVHHTDTHMDISTTVRFHPIEFLIQAPISATIILLSGVSPVAVMLYELVDAGINVFSHSNIRMPRWLDRCLSRVIVTPHVHRIHHSTVMPETNSNFGATLPVWDILFGTYRAKSADQLAAQPIGLDEMQDNRAYSLWWALSLPFRNLRRLKQQDSSDAPARSAHL